MFMLTFTSALAIPIDKTEVTSNVRVTVNTIAQDSMKERLNEHGMNRRLMAVGNELRTAEGNKRRYAGDRGRACHSHR
jgi:hypothetical protein